MRTALRSLAAALLLAGATSRAADINTLPVGKFPTWLQADHAAVASLSSWRTFATVAARDAATFTTNDVGRWMVVSSPPSMHFLVTLSPLVWFQMASQTFTTTTLATSGSPSVVGASVTLTATVTPSAATGTVTFLDGATSLGTGTLSGGVATLSTSALSVGTHSLTVSYGGGGAYLGSVSGAVSQVIVNGSVFTPTAIALPTDVPNTGRGQYAMDGTPSYPDLMGPDKFITMSWRSLENPLGTYHWNNRGDGYLDGMLDAAVAAGGKLRLTVYAQHPDTSADMWNSYAGSYTIGAQTGYHHMPDDLVPQVNPWITIDENGGTLTVFPDWNNAAYISHVNSFIEALCAHIASNDAWKRHFAGVSIMGYGTWNEWAVGASQMVGAPNGQTLITAPTYQALIDSQVTSIDSRGWTPFMAVDLSPALAYALSKNDRVGAESGSVGQERTWGAHGGFIEAWTTGVSGPPATAMQTRWQTAPLLGEIIQRTGTDAGSDALTNALNQGRIERLAAVEAVTDAFNNVPAHEAQYRQLVAESGFRVRVASATISLTSTTATWSVTWTNDGLTPLYGTWAPYISISGQGAVGGVNYMGATLYRLMPGEMRTMTGTITDTYIPGQPYRVDVAVIHPEEWNWRLNLAQQGFNEQDGTKHYRLGSITCPGASTVTSVSITSPPASVNTGTQTTFAASVTGTGTPSQAVTWSSTAGTWAGNVWTAPGTAQSVTITATSVQDNTKSGTATVAVQ